MPSPNDRRISIENLPLSVEHLMQYVDEYENLRRHLERYRDWGDDETIRYDECDVLLDLLDWLKKELT